MCITLLIAIKQEQKAKLCALGINTEFVGDAQTDPSAQARVINGEVQLVLISPENIMQLSLSKYAFSCVQGKVDWSCC